MKNKLPPTIQVPDSAPDISANHAQDYVRRPVFTSLIAGCTSSRKDSKGRYRESKSEPVQAQSEEAVAIEIDSTFIVLFASSLHKLLRCVSKRSHSNEVAKSFFC